MSVNNASWSQRAVSLSIFAVVNIFFLTVAFLAGYTLRAATVEAGLNEPLLGSRPDRYPLLAEARSLLEEHFIGPLPPDSALEHGAIRGLVSAVGDPYTVFIEPQAHELETQSLQGEFGGIGVTMSLSDAGEVVLSPYRDSPAERAGILDSDVLIAVDDTPLSAGAALDQATALIRGPVGTVLRLTVRHPSGEQVTLSVTRERFEIPSVTWRLIESQPMIGLVAVSRFSSRTAAEVGQAIEELHTSGAARYVLDLRNNGGGILEAAVDVAGHFLDGGVVMYETQHAAPEKTYSAPAGAGPGITAPLVVLVNHNTASAAEIVAGALLDRGRAPLVGQPTYGKGSVQLVYDLSDGSSVHVTAYRWYTPARREIEQAGLPPTHSVSPSVDGGDAELSFAVQLLTATDRAQPAALP